MEEIRDGIVPTKGLCTQPKYRPLFESSKPEAMARAQSLCGECKVANICASNLEKSPLTEGFTMVLGGQAVRVIAIVAPTSETLNAEAEIFRLRRKYDYLGEIPTGKLDEFQRKIAAGKVQEVEGQFMSTLFLAQQLREKPARLFTCPLVAGSIEKTEENLERETPSLTTEQIQPTDETYEQLRLLRLVVHGLGRNHPAGGGLLSSRLIEYAMRDHVPDKLTPLALRQGVEFAVKYVRYINAFHYSALGTVDRLADQPADLARLAMAFIADVAAFEQMGLQKPEVPARRFPPSVVDELRQLYPQASIEELYSALAKSNPHQLLAERFRNHGTAVHYLRRRQ